MKTIYKAKTTWILIVLIAAIGSGMFYCCRETAVPDDLIGVWETPDSTYADRFFEIKKDLIIFKTGGPAIDLGNILKIIKMDHEEKTLYTIYYNTDEGVDLQFSFYYEPLDGGKILLKNQQEIVWRKTDGGRFD